MFLTAWDHMKPQFSPPSLGPALSQLASLRSRKILHIESILSAIKAKKEIFWEIQSIKRLCKLNQNYAFWICITHNIIIFIVVLFYYITEILELKIKPCY